MSNLDALVTAFRKWAEDRLPWYDRAEEQRKIANTERSRRKAIRARIHGEESVARIEERDRVVAAVRNTVAAVRREGRA